MYGSFPRQEKKSKKQNKRNRDETNGRVCLQWGQWMHGEKYGDERNMLSPGKKNRISWQKKGCCMMEDGVWRKASNEDQGSLMLLQ